MNRITATEILFNHYHSTNVMQHIYNMLSISISINNYQSSVNIIPLSTSYYYTHCNCPHGVVCSLLVTPG